jgi:FtsH-binding integral membrane protein
MCFKNIARNIISAAMSLILILLIAAATYYFSGSLEVYPTNEQENKVKTVMGLVIGTLVIIELVLLFVKLRKIKLIICAFFIMIIAATILPWLLPRF